MNPRELQPETGLRLEVHAYTDPASWRWVLTDPHQLAQPMTGVRGHPGLWLIDLPPALSTGGNAARLTRPEGRRV